MESVGVGVEAEGAVGPCVEFFYSVCGVLVGEGGVGECSDSAFGEVADAGSGWGGGQCCVEFCSGGGYGPGWEGGGGCGLLGGQDQACGEVLLGVYVNEGCSFAVGVVFGCLNERVVAGYV